MYSHILSLVSKDVTVEASEDNILNICQEIVHTTVLGPEQPLKTTKNRTQLTE